MRYLIAETVALKPHLETAGEVALCARRLGHEVDYVWLGYDLPWSDWHLPTISGCFGCSLERRERAFNELLANKGVQTHSSLADEPEWKSTATQWANSFEGNLEKLKNFNYRDVSLGAGVASSLISFTGDANYSPQSDIARTRKCLTSALLVYLRTRKIIHILGPDVLVTFNGRFATSRPIVEAAQKAGISVLRHERGFDFQHYELFSDSIHNFDYINRRIKEKWDNANDPERRILANQFFQRRRRGDGIGWYSFTENQKKSFIPERILGKRRLVYFSSSDDEFASIADACSPGPWVNQKSAVQDLISACINYSDLELLIRVHPHLSIKSKALRNEWKNLGEKGIKVIAPDDPIDSYALIDSADIVATYGSTIGMEAAYWGKPSILLGPSSYRNSGAVLEPLSRDEIINLLSPERKLRVPDRNTCLPYGHYYQSYGKKFLYYSPESLSEGKFLGNRLGWDPWIIYLFRKIGVLRFLRRCIKFIKIC